MVQLNYSQLQQVAGGNRASLITKRFPTTAKATRPIDKGFTQPVPFPILTK